MGFEESRLWKEGLGPRADDPHAVERELLRVQLRAFRDGAAIVAAEIARDLPYFTVHDIRHLDALWDVAGEIAGPDLSFTPTELFVLGGAFFIHDLGMASASYPEGPASIEDLPAWKGVLATVLRRSLGRDPTDADLSDPPTEGRRAALEILLRQRHAAQAELLAREPIVRDGEDSRFLLEDAELRDSFARTIGRVAHSHWWPIESLPKKFPATQNAPVDFPREWDIDPLKLACLLRAADALHLDKLRAPSLLRKLRNPPGIADDHWVFQGALDPPRREDDGMRFTASRAFQPDDADAWWLCLDALRVADAELRQVDALFADLGRHRFAAKGVLGVHSPDRLAELIPTEDWIPKEATITVSDVAGIIDRLGGAKLYGDQLAVPLRELIQNAADAVELRKRQDGTVEPISITLEEQGGKEVLEVVDYGIGMSREVLTGPLLAFGTSLWSSDDFVDEFPDSSIDFNPIGAFGIGFFSVFMWSERIEVISRRFDAAADETYVLELKGGSAGRPLLRKAARRERRLKPGTTVRLQLSDSISSLSHGQYEETFAALCGRVAPSLGVPVVVRDREEDPREIVSASDWVEMPGVELLFRLLGKEPEGRAEATVARIAQNLRTLEGPDGVVGRLALVPDSVYLGGRAGVLAVGGLRSDTLADFAGVLEGVEPTAARNEARTDVSHEEIAAWASTQAELVVDLVRDPIDGMAAANTIGQLGGSTNALPICQTAEGYLSFAELSRWAQEREEAWILDLSDGGSEFFQFVGTAEPFEPADDVVALHVSGFGVPDFLRPPRAFDNPQAPVRSKWIGQLIDEALAIGWGLEPDADTNPPEPELEAIWDGPPRPVGLAGGREVSTRWVTPAAPRYAEQNQANAASQQE